MKYTRNTARQNGYGHNIDRWTSSCCYNSNNLAFTNYRIDLYMFDPET